MCTVSPLPPRPPPHPPQFCMKEYSNFVILGLNNLFVIRIWASVFVTLSKTNLLAQYNWNQSLPGYNGQVKPVKVVSPLDRGGKKRTLSSGECIGEVPLLGRPWSLNIVWKHWKVANIFIYVLSSILLCLSYQQFHLPLIHRLIKIKIF